ncbi:MAG: hypothetical protein BroJett040_25530 [Oligoflexia bacterium]|nr:MAG: hypothetical protein BroJett040_25530 [Oligoflexia bacterium]
MTKVKTFFKNLWKDESGQGTAEYVLLLVIVVALVLMFRGKIMELIKGKLEEIGSGMGQITTSGQ